MIHSDQGSQFGNDDFNRWYKDNQLVPSMSRRGVAAGIFFTVFQQLCGTTNDTPLRYVRRSKPGIHRKIVLSIKDWQALSRISWREYERCGVAEVMMICQPAAGLRKCMVMEHRKKTDFAAVCKELDRMFPDAHKITLVCDNLNTHTKGALYATFPQKRPADWPPK